MAGFPYSLPNLPSLSDIETGINSSATTGSLNGVMPGLGNIGTGVTASGGLLSSSAKLGANLSWGRVASFILGIAAIIIGLLMFKTTQTVIATTAKGAAKVAGTAVKAAV